MSRLTTDEMHRLAWALCLTLFAALTTSAGMTAEARQTFHSELQKPIQIHLKNGRTVPGHSIRVEDEQLRIATSQGAGEIIYTFRPEEIKRFEIPAESYKNFALETMRARQTATAIEIMEQLYEQRLNLLQYLPTSEPNFFTLYADLLKDRDPSRAVAIAENLLPLLQNPEAIQLAQKTRMYGYHALELFDRASLLAAEWRSAHTPFEDSALSDFILSEEALRSESYPTALELALKPIVFSGPAPKEMLAECYAVAIAAAIGLRDYSHAQTLHREMQERELLWPNENKTLKPYYEKLLEKINNL